MSQENNVFDFSITRKMVENFLSDAEKYAMITEEIIKFIAGGTYDCSDATLMELTKLNVNCHISIEYVKKMLEDSTENNKGVLNTNPESEANLVKCVRSLMESRKALKSSGISLEKH